MYIMRISDTAGRRVCATGCLLLALLVLPLSTDAQDGGAPDSLVIDFTVMAVAGVSTPVPVRVVNDQPLTEVLVPLRFQADDFDAFLSIDSIVYRGRMTDPTVLDFRQIDISRVDGVSEDTLLLAWQAMFGDPLPVGTDAVADIFVTGTRDGTVWIDSCFVPPATEMRFATGPATRYYPAFVAGELTLLMGFLPPILTLPERKLVMANREVSFAVAAESPEGDDVDISVLTVEQPATPGVPPSTSPMTSGFNPLQFVWTPGPPDVGIWEATFEACPLGGGFCAEDTTVIEVIVEADVNEDGMVNLTDLTQIVNWLFLNGPEPVDPVAADVNVSGETNLTDLTLIVTCLFLNG